MRGSDVRPARVQCNGDACGQLARVLERHDNLQHSAYITFAKTRSILFHLNRRDSLLSLPAEARSLLPVIPEYGCGDIPAKSPALTQPHSIQSRRLAIPRPEPRDSLSCSLQLNLRLDSSHLTSRTMGRSTIPSALAELSNPTSPEAQVVALRNLKNEIVGHEQRKELAVTHGIVKPLAALLREGARRGGKRRHSNGTRQESHNGSALSSGSAASSRNRQDQEDWTTEDELRFQATLVVGSLANGEHVIPQTKKTRGQDG